MCGERERERERQSSDTRDGVEKIDLSLRVDRLHDSIIQQEAASGGPDRDGHHSSAAWS